MIKMCESAHVRLHLLPRAETSAAGNQGAPVRVRLAARTERDPELVQCLRRDGERQLFYQTVTGPGPWCVKSSLPWSPSVRGGSREEGFTSQQDFSHVSVTLGINNFVLSTTSLWFAWKKWILLVLVCQIESKYLKTSWWQLSIYLSVCLSVWLAQDIQGQ